MSFILSKLLFFLVQPMNWVVLLLLAAVRLWRYGLRGRRMLRWALWLTLLLTNPMLVKLALDGWEVPPVPLASLEPQYEVGVVLGGYTAVKSPASEQPVFNPHGNRIHQAVRLYRMGRIRKILLTGGSGSLVKAEEPEAQVVMRYLRELGIPEADILVEDRSRNTFENAVFSKKTLEQSAISGRILLITSATHMRRASACYRKAGVEHDVFPVDYIAEAFSWSPSSTFLPDEMGFYKWQTLLKEWVGYVSYDLQGYL